jgi:DNA repair exonuclease SbcCD ATPase subunit
MEKVPNQAGGSPEQTQPSTENLKQQMEGLKAKVEVARLQKEKDIEQKIPERESLIAEVKKNDELLQTAQETLEYFTSMQQLAPLDDEDTKKLEELQTLVLSLENQRVELEKKISTISNQPEVLAKLQDMAQKENVEISVKNLTEQAKAELEPKVDQIAQEIKDLALRKNLCWQDLERQRKVANDCWRQITTIVEQAKEKLRGKSDFDSILEKIFRDSSITSEELLQKLSEARSKLGMFKGKEKASVDFISSQTQLFEKYTKDNELFDALEGKSNEAKSETNNIAEQFKAIILESWNIQNKINELLGNHTNFSGLPSNLNSRLTGQMEKIADIRRWEGNRQVGKHEGWFNATRSVEGDILYQTWKEVDNAVSGLIYTNPTSQK